LCTQRHERTFADVSSDLAMKSIEYRGGLVRFSIPAQWAEEYEPDGGGTFYDPAVEGVTLRLNVLTCESPRSMRRDESIAALARGASATDSPVEAACDDQALRISATKRVDDDGECVEIASWQLLRVAPPTTIRIAIFSTIVLVAECDTPATRATLGMLLARVRRAVIADVPAERRPARAGVNR
jgi:hypothetical protein